MNQVPGKPLDSALGWRTPAIGSPLALQEFIQFLFLILNKPYSYSHLSWSRDFILQIHETRTQKEEFDGELLRCAATLEGVAHH